MFLPIEGRQEFFEHFTPALWLIQMKVVPGVLYLYEAGRR
jgi:hypothetical protein